MKNEGFRFYIKVGLLICVVVILFLPNSTYSESIDKIQPIVIEQIVSSSVPPFYNNKSIRWVCNVSGGGSAKLYFFKVYKGTGIVADSGGYKSLNYFDWMPDMPRTDYRIKAYVREQIDSVPITKYTDYFTVRESHEPLKIESISANPSSYHNIGIPIRWTLNTAGGGSSKSYFFAVYKGTNLITDSGEYKNINYFDWVPEIHGTDYSVKAYVKENTTSEPEYIYSECYSVGGQRKVNDYVTEIKWSKFQKGYPVDDNSLNIRSIVLEQSKFILNKEDIYSRNIKNKYIVFSDTSENILRPPISWAINVAVAVSTGIYDELYVGKSCLYAKWYAIRIASSIAKWHKSNTNGGFGDQGQSALIAARTGLTAWLLWNDIGIVDRQYIQNMVEYEANRFIWVAPSGNLYGDTFAESIGWDAEILELAVAMMPNHPNAQLWWQKAIQYRMTQVSRYSDKWDTTVINGQRVNQWINVNEPNCYEDGMVDNHKVHPHPIYTCASLGHSMYSVIYYTFANMPVPESNFYHWTSTYENLVDKNWRTPEYALPGGTIYKDDGTVYWPDILGKEIDYSEKYYHLVAIDAIAGLLHLEGNARNSASNWERIHIEKLKSTDYSIEYNAHEVIARTYLYHWLEYNADFIRTNVSSFTGHQ